MDQPLVSIIIPVYKVEKYLRRCLDSVQNQTYKNIEVILVDDCSPDKCPQICDLYAEKDSRFHVIHKENGGVSSARNAGLDYVAQTPMRGGYIGFVDSDDWLPKNSIEVLLKRQIETNADYVCGNYMFIQLLKHRPCLLHMKTAFDKTDRIAFDRFFTTDVCAYTLWAHLYKKDIIEANNLSFKIDMNFGEDQLFNYQYLQSCNRIATTDEIAYYYNRINQGSLTRSENPNRNVDYFTFIFERQKVYPDFLTETEQYNEDAMALFYFSAISKEYISSLSKKKAVEKIKETILIFEPILSKIGDYDVSVKSEPIKSWLIYQDYINTSDYEGLHTYFAEQENYRHAKSRFSVIRKLLMRLREFQLFTLKLGYR